MKKSVKCTLIITAVVLTICIAAVAFFFIQPGSIKEEDFTLSLTVGEDEYGRHLCATLDNKSMHCLKISHGAQLITVNIAKAEDNYESNESEGSKFEESLYFKTETTQYITTAKSGKYKAKAIAVFNYKNQEIKIESNEIYFEIK